MTVKPEEVGTEDVIVTQTPDQAITTVQIDRPEVKNAMNQSVADGLIDAIYYAEETNTRVLLIQGSGGTFCSGGDLDAMEETVDVTGFRENFSILTDVGHALVSLDALTVAAVEGYCLAGGLGLAASCDFIIASDDATFGTPEIKVGLFPMQAMASIMRSTSPKKGLKLLFTGEFVGGSEASEMGLVTEVVPADEFEERLLSFVDTLANSNPLAISMGKRAYYVQRNMQYTDALEYLREAFAVLAASDEAREGIAAHQEDRQPGWSR